MANWNPEQPRKPLDLLQGLLTGDKPEQLKGKVQDEYGRAFDLLEDPATVQARLNAEQGK